MSNSGDPAGISPTGGANSPNCTRALGFVHINKAGGTAMLENLGTCCRSRLLKTQLAPKLGGRDAKYPRNFFFHGTGHRQQQLAGEQAWDDAYTFALVRNPWDRQVSMFHFLVNGQCGKEAAAALRYPKGPKSRAPSSRCAARFLPAAGEWLAEPKEAVIKFREWVRKLDEAYPVGHPLNYAFGSMAHGNDVNPWFNASQLSWIIGPDGKMLVDDVFKLETLDSEWPTILGNLCAPPTIASHANPSKHLHYSAYYDEETKQHVRRHSALDIRAFGYEFETKEAPL